MTDTDTQSGNHQYELVDLTRETPMEAMVRDMDPNGENPGKFIHASRLIDPEDMLLNSSINNRMYNVRVAVSRSFALMVEDWQQQFEAMTKALILSSLDIKTKGKDENGQYIKSYHGTVVHDMGDAIAVLFIASSDQCFFHFWSDDHNIADGYCTWVMDTLFKEKIADVFNEETNSRDISFWGHAGNDYEAFHRKVTLLNWEDSVEVNYPAKVKKQLEVLRDLKSPIEGGKIILMHGQPGTGKTSLIRSLARQWTSWCHTSYITDPENFLGHPGAMLKVVTWDYSQYIATGVKKEDAYHLLVIEDADELIAGDAKRRSGQALSRLLNIGDGLVGQSTNLLILITTNVEVGDLNAAVARPGRCLAQIHFSEFEYAEAVEWVKTHHPDVDPNKVLNTGKGYTLAELYQVVGNVKQIALEKPEAPRPGTYL